MDGLSKVIVTKDMLSSVKGSYKVYFEHFNTGKERYEEEKTHPFRS